MREVRSNHKLLQEIEEMRGRLSELGQRRFGEAWERMRKNENRYRTLFEDASTGLWEEDWSLVRDYLQSLKDSGVQDLKGYFFSHPDSATTCLDLIRLLDVNRAALSLCRTDHKRKFYLLSRNSPGGQAGRSILEAMWSLFEGAEHHSCQITLEVSPGEVRHLLLRIQVPHESKYSLERVFLSLTDVTDLKRTEARLRRRLELEGMMQRISSRFLSEVDVDRVIQESLGEVGVFVGASRSYVFLFDEKMSTMDNTHEWCELGVAAEKDSLQGISVEGRDWWMDNLREKRQIVIEDLGALPEEARLEKEDLQRQNIRSLVVMAFPINGRFPGGFVGFDNVWRAGNWERKDFAVLRILADTLGNALGRQETARMLETREKRFSSLFNSLSDAAYVFPLDRKRKMGTFCEVNDEACRRLGYSREELLRLTPLDVIIGEEHQVFMERQEILMREGRIRCENQHRTRDGRVFPVEITTSLVVLDGEDYVITLSRDISDRKEKERQMEYLIRHDSLTGLLNRRAMDQVIENEAENCRQGGQIMGILLVDIDDLEGINLAYGDAAGDEILIGVADLLKSVIGREAQVGRYGGDRFLVVMPGQSVEESDLDRRIPCAMESRCGSLGAGASFVTLSLGAADWDPVLELPVSAAISVAMGRLGEARQIQCPRSSGIFRQKRLNWGGDQS